MTTTAFIDKFDDPECRAGGEHQWYGDGYMTFYDHEPMTERQYNLLSMQMKGELKVRSCESTCNKCGIKYTKAHNPLFL